MDFKENIQHGTTLRELKCLYPTSLTGQSRHDYFAETMSGEDFERYLSARNRLVELNRGLVFEVAAGYERAWSGTLCAEDLASCGFEALLLKVVDWDPDAGAFSTFCMPWLKKFMSESLMAHRHGKRHSAEAMREASRLAAEYPHLKPAERAPLSNMRLFRNNPACVGRWTMTAAMLGHVDSLDAMAEGRDGQPGREPAAGSFSDADGELVMDLLARLGPISSFVVSSVFGFLTGKPVSLEKTLRLLRKEGFQVSGWTEVDVRRVLDSALEELRLAAGVELSGELVSV